jgi:hypothetical protein
MPLCLLQDAFLPQKLMDKLAVVVNHIEMARVTGEVKPLHVAFDTIGVLCPASCVCRRPP